ncbi:MAG: hypothetical protein RIQ60_141 [Pseudomonadota bacterium]|jgi:hypothetical protein
MKCKLLVTLVAGALELYAASAAAQAGCGLVGNASTTSGATAVTAGPLNPIDGFPEYVTDSTGLSVQRCVDINFCFFDPVVATDPFSLQIATGGEAFYWGADALLDNAAGKRVATVVMAAETAFLQVGPNGEPIDGTQFPFLRLRFTIGVPKDGTYTVEHPYGMDKFTVVGATGARDIFATVDRGLTAGATVQGPVGPWLKWDPARLAVGSSIPAGYLGDGGAAAVPNRVIGSPCGRNSVTLYGVDTRGAAVDFGGGQTRLSTNLFNVQGRVYDGRAQTPINPTRLTYSRSLTGAGQIDNFAASTPTAQVTVKDGPTIPSSSSRMAQDTTLDHLALDAATGINSLSVAVGDASVLPPVVSMTASDPNSATPTDPTTLNLHLVDFVDISAAEYDPATQRLTVTASSADLRGAPTLTLADFGPFAAGSTTKVVTSVAPPGIVTVTSSAGGSASALVRVMASTPPAAPTGLALRSATAATVTLAWTDTSSNETGFRVYATNPAGTRVLAATVGANTSSAVVSGLAPATAYTFQVEAFNTAGSSALASLSASTLALPTAPGAVSASLSTTTTRGINLSWIDNSSDETSFQILRATAVGGPYTQVASVAAAAGTGIRNAIDTNGPPAAGTTYFYQVVAVRGTDSSAPATSSGLTTPSAPTSAGSVTPVAVSATQVNISWTDRSANETGFQVWRRTGTTGTFAAVSAVLPANTTSWSDTSAVGGTQYFYRVDTSNWAATAPSAVSTGVTTPSAPTSATLVAPTGLSASAANQPVLSWTDASTGETAYRVRRTVLTVNANGSITTGSTLLLSGGVAANSTGYIDTTATRDIVYRYEVAPLNGGSIGPASTVTTVSTNGGLAVPSTPSLARSVVGTAARVVVTWSSANPTAPIGGYELQRCDGAGCTNFVKLTGTAVNTVGTVDGRTSLSFTDNNVARTTSYTYRVRAVGGAGTGLLSNFSSTRSVTTQ